ncbi:MAG: pyrroline-5-carboxylate reductase [Pseudomonadota bacterium]
MDFSEIAERGLVLLGCGKMGSALLKGWLEGGLPAATVHVIEPKPSDWLQSTGAAINQVLPNRPAVLLLAVKPQMMGDALPQVKAFAGGDTLVVSIAAGTSMRKLEEVFGTSTPVVRTMPNTPASVGQGITALVPNAAAEDGAKFKLAGALMSAVGDVVYLDAEDQIDAVTAVSGSGPAYVFLLIEALAEAGMAEGLAPEVAMKLARATVAGAGAMAAQSEDGPGKLRADVTSPAGTTAAALTVLMEDETGLRQLIKKAVRAAAARSLELG